MGIVDLAIRKPVTIVMVVAGVVIFGYVAFQRLAVNLLPDISYPSLTVRTEFEGAAPQEIENLVSRRIEEAVGVIGGLVEISSVSRAGVSDVILEFDWGADMNLATMDVRERVDRVKLPDDADRPLLLRYNPQLDPIMRVGLSGGDLTMLRDMAEWNIKRQLETIPGVASVRVKGGLEEEIHVEVDEAQLARLGMTFQQVGLRLEQENINLAGGRLKEGQEEFIVRAVNEFRTVDEIGDLIITRPNGAPVKLRDVARVTRTHKERKTITRINGDESVEIALYKEADANTVTVAKRIRARLGADGKPAGETAGGDKPRKAPRTVAAMLPPGVTLHVVSDQSRFIEEAIDEVLKTALYGGILAILVLYLFLRNARSTGIVGLAIPVSILMTFTLMFFSSTTLNIMSLGGLALGIGMLVDNAIVVLESIFRCREEGDGIKEAALRGASEVGTAVTASTLTTIAVFFPIVFVKGVAGQIFTDQALTVTFSLMASLAVALTVIPMLASRESRAVRTRHGGLWLQGAWRAYHRAPPVLGGAWPRRIGCVSGWFGRRLWQDAGRWFLGTFPGLGWFGRVRRDFRGAPGSAGPRSSFRFSGYLLRRALREIGAWAKECVLQQRAPSGAARGWRKISRGTWRGVAWLVVFLVRLLRPAYLLLRFIVQSALTLAVTLVLHIALVVLALAWQPVSLLRYGRVLLLPALYLFDAGFGLVRRAYPRVLSGALAHRGGVLLGTGGLLLLALLLVPRLGTELIPEMEQGEFHIDVKRPVGTPLASTEASAGVVEAAVRRDPAVDRVYVVVGETEASGTSLSEERENFARVGVVLKADAVREHASDTLIERLRRRLRTIPDATIEFARPALFSFKTPLEVEIQGYDLSELRRVSGEVVASLRELDGLRDVHSSMEEGYPEIIIVFDRARMASLGLDIGAAARAVRDKVRGAVATRFAAGDRRIDILVRAREQDRNQVARLKRLTINTSLPGNGDAGRSGSPENRAASRPPVPLGAVAHVEIGEGPSEIRRIDQRRVALVSANLSGVDLGSVARRIEGRLARVPLPDDFTIDVGGQYREMNTASRSMLFAMGMAVFLVYLVMASQFESLLHPFVIMISFVLALVGVSFTLYLFHIAVSVIVLIGVIMLAGIVVNNAIVLVDYINQLRRRGRPRLEAVMTAGQVRLRPILMTTATTVLGLLPMALGLGEGAEIRTPLAITVIAGLVSSTILTLIVIPVIYTLVDRRD